MLKYLLGTDFQNAIANVQDYTLHGLKAEKSN